MTLTDTCTYVNTGDWLFNRNYAVYDTATYQLTLHNLIDG